MPYHAAPRWLRRDETLLGAVLFGFLVLLSLQVTAPDGQILFKRIVYQMVAPLLRAGDFIYRHTTRVARDYAAFRAVVRDNETLRERVAALERERLDHAFLLHDYANVRALADYRATLDFPTLVARVVARDIRDPWRMLVVNRGRTHGVEPGMAVLAAEGIVGRVVTTSNRTAQVQLLTDAQSALAGIHLPTDEQVLVEGRGTEWLHAVYFSTEAPVAAGDGIVTSGFEGIYPQGLWVGRVERVESERSRPVAWVRPAAPVTRLTSVLVVMSPPKPRRDRDAEPEAEKAP